MGLVLDWKASLGYRFDPFEPTVLSPITLVGLDDLKERFNLWLIKGGSLGTIAGDKGSGKTMVLKWIEIELAPKKSHQQHYLDAKAGASADELRHALGARPGLMGKIFSSKAKDDNELLARLAKQQSVILIDNAGGLRKDALALLGTILDKTPAHAVLTDTQERLAKLELPAKDGLGLRIGRSSHEDLRAILTWRINAAGVAGTHPFGSDDLAKIVKEADGNPAQLLRAARERAIELSLKAGKGQATAAATPAASDASSPSGEKKKLFSIRIAKAPQKQEAPKRAPAPKHESEGSTLDAAALNEIVAQAAAQEPPTHNNPPVARKPALSNEEIQIFEELAGKDARAVKSKPVRKAAKRKAPAKRR